MSDDGSHEFERRAVEAEARLAHAERSLDALRQVSLALGTTLDRDQLLELILSKTAELLSADRATLYLLDEDRGLLVSELMIGDSPQTIELPIGEGIAGWVAKTGKTLRVRDAYRDKRFRREWDDLTGYRTQSILAAPMKNHFGRIIGVVQVINKKDSVEVEFSEHDEDLLVALATQAAVSIDNSRLFVSVIQKNLELVQTKEELERRVSDLKLLFELESAMSRATSLEGFARAIIGEAAKACEASAGGVLVDEGEAGVFLYFVEVVDSAGKLRAKRVALKRGETLVGRAMARGEAVSADARPTGRDTAAFGRLPALVAMKLHSAIVVPLDGEDDSTAGALALFNSHRERGFMQDDRALLRLVSANASTALRLFRSRAEREKTERLTEIGRLLSGVMHDVRTPLTVVRGHVELMARAKSRAERDEHERVIAKQFESIGAMQHEVLEYARGERTILLRKVYLTKFFEEVARHLEHAIGHSNIKLVLDLRDRGVARFDEAKITRVVHNLGRNAIEAMHDHGGTLTLRVDREDGALVLSISDTGAGLPKELAGRLFTSFATAGKVNGTGLGLSIVKKIVDEHGGTITVESSARGATFTVRLPQDQARVAKPLPQATPVRADRRGKRREVGRS